MATTNTMRLGPSPPHEKLTIKCPTFAPPPRVAVLMRLQIMRNNNV